MGDELKTPEPRLETNTTQFDFDSAVFDLLLKGFLRTKKYREEQLAEYQKYHDIVSKKYGKPE